MPVSPLLVGSFCFQFSRSCCTFVLMQNYKNPALVLSSPVGVAGDTVEWQSPSNLAIIKYWGKHGRQLPRNPSISFTLQNAHTHTRLHYQPRREASGEIALEFRFDGVPHPPFGKKVRDFLKSILPFFPFLAQLHLHIDSSNSFPHSAGIASSASAMSALALCLCSLEQKLFGTLLSQNEFLQKASYIARLGSGSACRSVYPVMGLWGTATQVAAASDEYAIPFEEEVHPVFHHFHDDILIVSSAEKSVSSRVGHALMNNNIYATNRYAQARQRFDRLLAVLRAGDIPAFGQIAEAEALTLHALMMAAEPSYVLLQPNTLAMIEKIRTFRKESGLQVFFSLDAGPNIHLLYPDEIKTQLQSFIQDQLIPLCQDGRLIADQVGRGPVELTQSV